MTEPRTPPDHARAAESPTTAALRRAVLAILVLVLAGTETELLLLRHTEDVWQLVPVVLIPVALVLLAWHAASRGASALRAFRWLMALCLAAGGVGVIQHYRANLVDAGESDPSLGGRALYVAAIEGSIPALAPGTMVQIGLLGLVFAYKHPRLSAANQGRPRS